MTLPDPGTRSPGKLVIRYREGPREHSAGVWFKDPNDFSAISAIRGEAIALANALMDYSLTTSNAYAWEIRDPDGQQLYTEPFDPVISGVLSIDSEHIGSQSTSISTIGRGVGVTVGVAFGRTRTFVFPGWINVNSMNNPTLAVGGAGYDSGLRDFMDNSLIVGADFYGQGAEYNLEYNVQVNAHHQKKYGL